MGERGVAFCNGVSLTSQTEGAVWQGSSLGSAALSPAPPPPHGISTRLMMIHHSFSKLSPRLPSALLHSCTLVLFSNPPSAGLLVVQVPSSPWGPDSL